MYHNKAVTDRGYTDDFIRQNLFVSGIPVSLPAHCYTVIQQKLLKTKPQWMHQNLETC